MPGIFEPSMTLHVHRTRSWPEDVLPPGKGSDTSRTIPMTSKACSRLMFMHVAMGMFGSGIVGFPAPLRIGVKVVCSIETTSVFGALLYCCFTLETKLGLLM